MHRFAAELTLDALDKRRTPDGNGFRPAIVTQCAPRAQAIVPPIGDAPIENLPNRDCQLLVCLFCIS